MHWFLSEDFYCIATGLNVLELLLSITMINYTPLPAVRDCSVAVNVHSSRAGDPGSSPGMGDLLSSV